MPLNVLRHGLVTGERPESERPVLGRRQLVRRRLPGRLWSVGDRSRCHCSDSSETGRSGPFPCRDGRVALVVMGRLFRGRDRGRGGRRHRCRWWCGAVLAERRRVCWADRGRCGTGLVRIDGGFRGVVCSVRDESAAVKSANQTSYSHPSSSAFSSEAFGRCEEAEPPGTGYEGGKSSSALGPGTLAAAVAAAAAAS